MMFQRYPILVVCWSNILVSGSVGFNPDPIRILSKKWSSLLDTVSMVVLITIGCSFKMFQIWLYVFFMSYLLLGEFSIVWLEFELGYPGATRWFNGLPNGIPLRISWPWLRDHELSWLDPLMRFIVSYIALLYVYIHKVKDKLIRFKYIKINSNKPRTHMTHIL